MHRRAPLNDAEVQVDGISTNPREHVCAQRFTGWGTIAEELRSCEVKLDVKRDVHVGWQVCKQRQHSLTQPGR